MLPETQPQREMPDKIDDLLLTFNSKRSGRWPPNAKDAPLLICLVLGSIAGSYALPGIPFLLVIFFLWWAFGSRTTSSNLRAAIVRLASLHDPRTVTYLIHSLAWPDMEMARPIITTALTHLLPKLSTDEFLNLPAVQRDVLYRNVNLRDCSLTRAILDAVKNSRHVNALSSVSRLARRSPQCHEENLTVAAATECLQILHTEKARRGDTMLRASEAPRASDEFLLKPLSNKQTDSALLVQPSPNLQNEVRG